MALRNWSKGTVRMVTLALAFWVAALDPFQMNTRFDSASQAAADHVVAPFYDRERLEQSISDALALVTIDATTVRRDHTYPVAYDELAAVVQAAADQRTKAVFLDFAFFNRGLDPKGSSSRDLNLLVTTIAAARAAGVSVFTGPIDADPALDRLRAAVSGQAAITWSADHPLDYPFAGKDFYDHKLPMPAVLLFRAYCTSRDGREPSCDQSLFTSLNHQTDRLSTLAPLAIQFGHGPVPGQQRFTDPGALASCNRTEPTEWAVALARGLQQGALGPPSAPCPSHLEIPIQDLPAALDLIRGRLLVVGLTPELGDGFVAPGVGRVAGGAVHLMAIDNLIHYGAAYPKWPPNWFWALSWTGIFKIAVVFLIPVVIEEAGHLATRPMRSRRIVLWTIFVSVLLAPIGGAVLLGMIFHTPPGGVAALGLLSIGVVAFFEDEALVTELGIAFGPTVATCLMMLTVAGGLIVAALSSGRAAFGIEALLLVALAISLLLLPQLRRRLSRSRRAHTIKVTSSIGEG